MNLYPEYRMNTTGMDDAERWVSSKEFETDYFQELARQLAAQLPEDTVKAAMSATRAAMTARGLAKFVS